MPKPLLIPLIKRVPSSDDKFRWKGIWIHDLLLMISNDSNNIEMDHPAV